MIRRRAFLLHIVQDDMTAVLQGYPLDVRLPARASMMSAAARGTVPSFSDTTMSRSDSTSPSARRAFLWSDSSSAAWAGQSRFQYSAAMPEYSRARRRGNPFWG
jgi:hypothetical protein